MITKHFFKILAVFSIMIILGLIGVFLTNTFGQEQGGLNTVNNKTQVAK
jgi:hypothetical protein